MNWNSKKNPLGNFDDPTPPIWFKPESSMLARRIGWAIRNPFHNLMAYCIWFKDRDWKLSIWKDNDGINIVLPFISYKKGGFEAYIGWRPDSRILGFAIRRH